MFVSVMELLSVLFLILLLAGLIRLLKPLLQGVGLAISLPVLTVYYLAFVPEKRKDVLTLLKVFLLPVLVLLSPYIISFKYYRRGDKAAGVLLGCLYTLTALVIYIRLQAP